MIESTANERARSPSGFRGWVSVVLEDKWTGRIVLAFLIVSLLMFPVFVERPFLLLVLIRLFFFATLAQSWNILGGYAGQLSLGQAIFLGIGAYTSTLLLTKLGISPWIGMVVGVLIALVGAILIGIPLFRLRGHYFAIATWLLVEITQILVINWRWAGGAMGINLPFLGDTPAFFQFNSRVPYYYIALTITALVFATTFVLERTKPGYIFRAIKDDPEAASSLGVNILRFQLIAFMIYAMFSAMMGTFFAQLILVISPDSLLILDLAVLAMLMAVLGGMGNLWGPLIGAIILVPAAEYTRVWLGARGDALSVMIYGLLIVLLAIYQPEGLTSLFNKFRRRLRGE